MNARTRSKKVTLAARNSLIVAAVSAVLGGCAVSVGTGGGMSGGGMSGTSSITSGAMSIIGVSMGTSGVTVSSATSSGVGFGAGPSLHTGDATVLSQCHPSEQSELSAHLYDSASGLKSPKQPAPNADTATTSKARFRSALPHRLRLAWA